MAAGFFWDAQPAALHDEIGAVLGAGEMSAAFLAEFDFVSGPVRLSNWTVAVTDGKDGNTWQALPAPWAVADISSGPDSWAPLRVYSMQIQRDILTRFDGEAGPFPDLKNKANYHKRSATMFLQMMKPGAGPSGEALPLGYPVTLHKGRMDSLVFSMTRDGVNSEMRVEGFLARKRVQGSGVLTPRDQRRRHAGDLGLDYIPEVQVRPAIWPDY